MGRRLGTVLAALLLAGCDLLFPFSLALRPVDHRVEASDRDAPVVPEGPGRPRSDLAVDKRLVGGEKYQLITQVDLLLKGDRSVPWSCDPCRWSPQGAKNPLLVGCAPYVDCVCITKGFMTPCCDTSWSEWCKVAWELCAGVKCPPTD